MVAGFKCENNYEKDLLRNNMHFIIIIIIIIIIMCLYYWQWHHLSFWHGLHEDQNYEIKYLKNIQNLFQGFKWKIYHRISWDRLILWDGRRLCLTFYSRFWKLFPTIKSVLTPIWNKKNEINNKKRLRIKFEFQINFGYF